MNIAIFGDLHGHWVECAQTAWKLHGKVKLDAILQCGDAMPVRAETDLAFVNCPEKYRERGDFSRILSGEHNFPAPFLFIGGNHEPYNFLDEHMDGGPIAQGIYYMGRCGFRMLNPGFSVSGLSGIYSKKNFENERIQLPYDVSKRKLATYFNQRELHSMIGHPLMHILLIHEWPDLMNRVRDDSWPTHWDHVGQRCLTALIEEKAPRWTFCGHMHKRAHYDYEGCQIVCLGDFSTDSMNSCGVLNTDNNAFVWLGDIV